MVAVHRVYFYKGSKYEVVIAHNKKNEARAAYYSQDG